MIIIKTKGGLGNQMFQYAFGRALSLKLNTQLKLDTLQETNTKGIKKDIERPYSLNRFNIKAELTSQEETKKLRKPFKLYLSKLYRKLTHYNYYTFDQSFLEQKDDSYFEGFWWQSEKYFRDIRTHLLEDFTLVNPLGTEASKIAESIKQSESAVSLHVRRGDYVHDATTLSHHGLATLEYYKKAIEIINEKVSHAVFFIFSDDIEWVKENLALPPLSFFVSDKNLPDYEELILMSLCKHFIIANSSFSWWGAWLCQNPEKLVIAPKKWIADPSVDTNDIYPPSWIRV